MMPGVIHILYVDDEPALLDLAKVFLEIDREFSVDTCTSASQALGRLGTETYDAIISDYQMPEMNGIAFLRHLRASGDTTPFIIFTGKGREEVVIEALNEGADFYLQKGGSPGAQFAELSHKIRHAISRKQAVLALRKSELDYRHLIEHASEAIYVVQDGVLRMVNPKLAEMTGYSEQELANMPISLFIYPDDRAMVIDRYERRIRGETMPNRYTFRLYRKEKTVRWVELSVVVISWDNLPAVLVFLIDVTERKNTEDALRESEERYRQFFKTTRDSVFITTPDGGWIDCNDALAERLGYKSREEVMGVPVASAYAHPEERAAFIRLVEREGYVTEYPLQFRRRDGTVFGGLMTIVPLKNPDGSLKAFIGTVRDTPGQKQVLASPSDREPFDPGRAENLLDYIVVSGEDGKILYVNPATTKALGYAADDMTGTPLVSYIAEESRQKVSASIATFQEREDVPLFEIDLLARDGLRRSVIAKGKPVRYGSQQGTLLFLIDITRKKALEEQLTERANELQRISAALQQANKQLTLLSSITRHDINNQLTVLTGFLSLLEPDLADPRLADYCRKAGIAAERIAAMIRFARDYETIGAQAPIWQDLRVTVDKAAGDAPLGRIRVMNDLPTGREVLADPLIVKVMYNLMDNAARYGGKITTIRFFLRESVDTCTLICEDDGDGVAAAEKEKIFERGFGKNTGLGLAISREILAITGITIRETGEPGKGARFEIAVPKEAYRSTEPRSG